jgi:hypothetical protein
MAGNWKMKVYKFVSDSRFVMHKDSFLRAEVRLAEWARLNDPMEGVFVYLQSRQPSLLNTVIGAKARYRISCFSKGYEGILLWSHYANGHKGICLEYEVEAEGLSSGHSELAEVQYASFLANLDYSMTAQEQARLFLLRKLTPWKYEKEVRLLCEDSQPHTVVFGRIVGVILGLNWLKGEIPNDNDLGCSTQSVHRYIQSRAPASRLYAASISRRRPIVLRGRPLRLEPDCDAASS